MNRALTDDRGRPVREDGSLMRPEMADVLADTVVERLRPILEPATIPAHIVEWFKKIAEHGGLHLAWSVPCGSPYGPTFYVTIRPGGTMDIEIADINACIFYRTTLRGPM